MACSNVGSARSIKVRVLESRIDVTVRVRDRSANGYD